MKALLSAAAFVVGFSGIFALVAFVQWETNPGEMTEMSRFFIAWVGGFLGGSLAAFTWFSDRFRDD